MNIPEIPFRVPVRARLLNGLDHSFLSVYDALDFLEYEWPSRRGERYEQALHHCRAALNNLAPVELAREAFISACLEAGMPLTVEQAPLAGRVRVKGHPPPPSTS
ncbi:DUF982 domain-containing protein (plasmid) [Neorhizobium sp. SOG26]|uniref:DUF982 domain-containing protein n=1 Tax=Neorhizobium sp. SOG26 TaxID=2060726 RepID=UPI000E59409C|nr:DUF982 domain-containing protein [Neorhizobium sp. SOG26]AXV17775.1 DUF982 domain-containing protein [Neorhizobium sp. SOG26]